MAAELTTNVILDYFVPNEFLNDAQLLNSIHVERDEFAKYVCVGFGEQQFRFRVNSYVNGGADRYAYRCVVWTTWADGDDSCISPGTCMNLTWLFHALALRLNAEIADVDGRRNFVYTNAARLNDHHAPFVAPDPVVLPFPPGVPQWDA